MQIKAEVENDSQMYSLKLHTLLQCHPTEKMDINELVEQIGEDRFSYDRVCAGMPSQQYYKGTQHTKLYAHDTV